MHHEENTVPCCFPSSRGRRVFAAAALAAGLLLPDSAQAQQRTFHLDRLEVPGAPGDGVALFRPTTEQRDVFYGQLAVGYQLRPLRVRSITSDPSVLSRRRGTSTGVVENQLSMYGSAGFQFLDRFTLGVNFPWVPYQSGSNPDYGPGNLVAPGQASPTPVNVGGPTDGDVRLDARAVVLRSSSRRTSLGAQASVFLPTGTKTDFGGDGSAGVLLMVSGEHSFGQLTLVANTGVHMRPEHTINDPVGKSGLGVSNEWRWAVGGFVPLRDGTFRIGATVFGQTGLTTSDNGVVGSTIFTEKNTPIEWEVEGRMRFGPAHHWWFGVSGGTRLVGNAYGAPDFRAVGLLGTYVPLFDTHPKSPEERVAEARDRWRREGQLDRDKDGIPDDIDLCPNEPEDHRGNDPNDGCPMPPDRDGDGILDRSDKCPDQPEDKDGIDDGDGCPEVDADSDGVPDVEDACPKVPGKRNADPKKNGCPTFIVTDGSTIRVLQQVHFQFGTSKILPDSFPVLGEINDLLRANPSIERVSIEGHTDNHGAAELNRRLSQDRANSVMAWLVQHGVDANRLEAHGYGLERPIEDNKTEAGRAANRRVEFKIVKEHDSNQSVP